MNYIYYFENCDKFIKNKYYHWYLDIINKGINEGRIRHKKSNVLYVYYERHHILPKCIFPEFALMREHKWNCSLLTAREHFIAHLLLPRFMRDTDSRIRMNHALNWFLKKGFTSRKHDSERQRISKEGITEETRIKIGISSSKKVYTDDIRKRMSESHKGLIRSKEHKINLSMANKGKKPSIGTRKAVIKKCSRPFKVQSPEGTIYEGVNLRKFCRKMGLHQAAMNAVRKGTKPHYKGWIAV